MRVIAQRVKSASVEVAGAVIGEIETGLVLLVGIHESDDDEMADRLAAKTAVMRVFEDAGGKMNLSASDVGGAMLVVSQFTLYADLRKGRRPSFVEAADPDKGRRLVERFATRLEQCGYRVERGRFGAHMLVRLENDGPVTIVLDSREM